MGAIVATMGTVGEDVDVEEDDEEEEDENFPPRILTAEILAR